MLFLTANQQCQSTEGNPPYPTYHKNSSVDEIANVNFYAVRPEDTRIRWNNAK